MAYAQDDSSIVIDLLDEDSYGSGIDAEKEAEAKKELGNQQYKLKHYMKAVYYYSEAIELCPNSPAYYGNRSAAYIMLGNYTLALEDAMKSVKLDHAFVKGWIRVAKCHLVLGDLKATSNALDKVAELEPNNPTLAQERENLQNISYFEGEAEKALEKKEYRKVLFCYDRVLNISSGCVKFKVKKAECLVHLGRYPEAQEILNAVTSVDKCNLNTIIVNGLCFYYQENLDCAMKYFMCALKLAPDNKEAAAMYKKAKKLKQKKEEGNAAFEAGKNAEAYDLYSEGLTIDPENKSFNAKLYCNRAAVCAKMNELEKSVSDCTIALELSPQYLKAFLRRANSHMQLANYEEAVKDYESAFKLDRSRETQQALRQAKLELKKSQRKDYYKILGIDKSASNDEIKRAYRKRALVHHPDRHAGAPEMERKAQEILFKEVGEAYNILSDPNKRRRYDNGENLEDMEGMSQNLNAYFMFQDMFKDAADHQFGGFSGAQFTFPFG